MLETNNKKNCEILARYFEALPNCEKPQDKLDFALTTPNKESESPTLDEAINIIKSLKNNKAPGEDGIIAEIWKLDTVKLAPKIHTILTEIWNTGKVPSDWKTALIQKKGDRTDPNNYRGISLLTVIYMVLSKALLTRVESQTDHLIGEYQGGFRKGRSCSEQIWNLRMILTKRCTTNPVVTFMDFKKAYDSIDRDTLFNVLREYKTDRKTVELIKETLTNTTSRVKFQGELSEPCSKLEQE